MRRVYCGEKECPCCKRWTMFLAWSGRWVCRACGYGSGREEDERQEMDIVTDMAHDGRVVG